MRVRIAWAAALLSVCLAVVDTIFSALHAPLLSRENLIVHGWPTVSLATTGAAILGALIISRYPRHPVGWLLIVTGASSLSVATEAYWRWALGDGGQGPEAAPHIAAWVSALSGAPLSMTAVVLIYLLAPDGQLLSPRWRWVGRTAVLGLAMYVGSVLAQSPVTFDVTAESVQAPASWFLNAGIVLMVLSLIASAVGLVLRLRRAQGEVRRQLLWIATSAALLALAFGWFLVGALVSGPEQSDASVVALFIGYLSIPVCTAVAVLRHRLFDIDVIVSRAALVFLATALAGGAYVLVVVLLGAALGGQVGFAPSLLATALVALAFQPLRRRVMQAADRLAYGESAEPYDALAEFSRRLGDSPDPTDLLPAVAEAAASAVRAQYVRVELLLPSGPHPSASVGSPRGGPVVQLPVGNGDDQFGVLLVEVPAGRSLRPRDLALLDDLAAQALVAFRNARLSAELSHRIDELSSGARALEESRHRLITARDTERSRLERAVTRDVVTHLQALPERLEDAAAEGATPEGVGLLLAGAEQALQALREITRGVYPAQLSRSGLESALRSLLSATPGARLVVDSTSARVRGDERVEAAAYFCVAESVRDLLAPIEVRLVQEADGLALDISGGRAAALPIDLMRDRVEALDGSLSVREDGDSTLLHLRLREPALVSG
ncbi:MAG: hypothetical protein JF597_50675 [Streptomyces sp.]|uniref:hypothetical protein n=1 Tax=Streptomyces sp. TaxID=1931 RepID=UPI0025DC0623|nr:hypothetical protein [Streptomyces sp.]MBW8801514.1 hypothetical protein [Streptomyces sp.]